MKKFFTAIAVAILAALCLSAVACGQTDDNDNTGATHEVAVTEYFKGKLSEESYASAEAAAAAFLEDELAGSTTDVEFVSYQKTGELSAEELAQFDLGDLDVSEVDSAEKGVVSYRLETVQVATARLATSAAGNLREQALAILRIGSAYRYFVPATGTGEMVTKSYYESFWSLENYLNCTTEFKMTVSITASMDGMTESMEMGTSISMKVSENAIEYRMVVSAMGELEETLMYIVDNGGALYGYIYNDMFQTWQGTQIAVGQTLAEYLLENSGEPEYFDYTYFEMTESGFKLAPEKYELYIQNFLAANPQLAAYFSGNATGEATYFVENGKMQKATTYLEMESSAEGMTMKVVASGECVYKDYGTTTVTLPADLLA